MISKEVDNKKNIFLWTSNIFIIPNDLFYHPQNLQKNNVNFDKNENKSDSDSNSETIFFTELLKPNWKKHINNYVRRKYSGYRKKIRKIFD
jgi:hypothetical protein